MRGVLKPGVERELKEAVKRGKALWAKANKAKAGKPAKQAAAVAAQFTGLLPEGGAVKSVDNMLTDIDCDACGKPMKIKKGKRGYFLGCSGYPKCKNTGEVPAKLVEELGIGEARPGGAGGTKGEEEALETVDSGE